MRLSPVLTGMRTYPFVRLTEATRAAAAAGVEVINFGIGEPREETPEFIREALRGGDRRRCRRTRTPRGCPSCGTRSPAGPVAASA